MQDPLGVYSWIINIIFIIIFFIIFLCGRHFLNSFQFRKAEAGLRQLKLLHNEGKKLAKQALKEIGISPKDAESLLDEPIGFFTIDPNKDPLGVLEQQDEFDVEYSDDLAEVAPFATDEDKAYAEAMLSGYSSLHYIYRAVRHFLLLAKKTKSQYYSTQLEMQFPSIIQMAKAHFETMRAFSTGIPIGDGIGPLVVAQFARDIAATPPETIAHHTIVQEGEFEGRFVQCIRGQGSLGHPGKAIQEIVSLEKGKIACIITVGSIVKSPEEKTGEVIRGVGAVLGDPGPEKIRVEEAARRYDIPLYAVLVKQSLEEAQSPMSLELIKAVPNAIDRLQTRLLDRCKKGDVVIIAGIGNSLGIT